MVRKITSTIVIIKSTKIVINETRSLQQFFTDCLLMHDILPKLKGVASKVADYGKINNSNVHSINVIITWVYTSTEAASYLMVHKLHLIGREIYMNLITLLSHTSFYAVDSWFPG